MRVLLQRVAYAQCVVDQKITGKIEKGYLLFVGFNHEDNETKLIKASQKIINLRVFEDEQEKMNLNLAQVDGQILSISQFTLYANTEKGNRPSFIEAMNPQDADVLYHRFNEILKSYGVFVGEGIFGAHMEITLMNDGPVTIELEF